MVSGVSSRHGRGAAYRFAEAIGITRSYAAMLVSGKAGCSSFVMLRIKRFMGINDGSCWCHLFEESRCDDAPENHPITQSLNQAKYMGEVPYKHLSIAVEKRAQDYPAEEQQQTIKKDFI